MALRFGGFQVGGTSMKGRSGRENVLFLKSPYISKVTLLTWMFPGPTTIVGSCAVTLVFAVMLTLPLRRLRMATRQIASGNLDFRVPLRHRLIRFGRSV